MNIESWATAGTIAAGLVVAFRIGIWFCDRRAAALAAAVSTFCAEITAYYRAREDGEITDEEAREIAQIVGRLVEDLETVAGELCRQDPPR